MNNTYTNAEEIKKLNFETIPIDEFWNVGNEKELKMHRIHSYPAKFPAFITTKAIGYAKNVGVQPLWIADFFCGCGTVALEAKRNGINFWGSDINPVATMIARTKSLKYNDKLLNDFFIKIRIQFKRTKKAGLYKCIKDERINYWFKKGQIGDLYRLKNAIKEVTPSSSKYRIFFLCAFSNILKPASKWLAKSIKPQIDPNKKIVRVWKLFEKQFIVMQTANKELNIENHSKTIITTRNALNIEKIEFKPEMIITSPPYVTSYEYADLHQLSTLWLDYAKDYRKLRSRTIGSVRHKVTLEEEKKHLNLIGLEIVEKLNMADKSKAKLVARYYNDMQQIAKKSYKILKTEGLSVYVIGNTEYKKVRIDNAKHLATSLIDAGFENVYITKRKITNKILTPYRDENGCFTTDKTIRKIYNEEFIIIGRKK
jgi:adenine-specific DNA methylase